MKNFRVGLGVCGGIAAYKAIELMRLLQRSGCDVSVAMTRHATEFVAPLTFRALTGRPVIVDDYDPSNADPIAHINFSQNIDLLIVAPATANIIAKFANGIADDFLSSTLLAATAPVLIAPAMNTAMWENAATKRNVARLIADGVFFVEPIAGELACKTVGTGKLEDVENIAAQALALADRNAASDGHAPVGTGHASARQSGPRAHAFGSNGAAADLAGERILITIGGTREPIDPVRFISNRSSGKMGFAIAEAAMARGAEVTAVCGITTIGPPPAIKSIIAPSAEEMYAAAMSELPSATVFIGAAAVADYRPASAAANKIKKDGRQTFSLELVRTRDILGDVSAKRPADMLVVGFAAETEDLVAFARAKMEKKNLDIVVANDVAATGAGFDSDLNAATILTRASGAATEIPLMPKRVLADLILNEIVRLRKSK